MPFGSDPAPGLPRLLLPGPRSGQQAGPAPNPSRPSRSPELPCSPKPADPAGEGFISPPQPPGPALPRREGELGRDLGDLLVGGRWEHRPPHLALSLTRVFPARIRSGGQSRSRYPVLGQTWNVSVFLALGPVSRVPATRDLHCGEVDTGQGENLAFPK